MDMNIVSTTEIQRNFKRVLDRLNATSEPLVVVRDSQPEIVMLPYLEYKRLSEIEKQMVKQQMEMVWEKMRKKNAKVSDKELNADIEEAVRYARRGS